MAGDVQWSNIHEETNDAPRAAVKTRAFMPPPFTELEAIARVSWQPYPTGITRPLTEREELQSSLMRLSEQVERLSERMGQMSERVDWLVGAVHNMSKAKPTGGEDGPDNYDMKAEEIKNLIQEKYDLSKPTYPSDVANDHGLDYNEVLKAVDLLCKEGRVAYDK